jgi:hypothetical protein
MTNRNNIEEISDLLAQNILSETILTKENIKTKCKVFLIAWQRINTKPKKDILQQGFIDDANSFKILKTFIENEFKSHFDNKKIDELMNNFNKLNNLTK